MDEENTKKNMKTNNTFLCVRGFPISDLWFYVNCNSIPQNCDRKKSAKKIDRD